MFVTAPFYLILCVCYTYCVFMKFLRTVFYSLLVVLVVFYIVFCIVFYIVILRCILL